MIRFMPKNNTCRGEIRLFNIINTTNNNENALFSFIDKSVFGKKEETVEEEVVMVEKENNLGLIAAIIGATIIAVTSVSWLLFTALKLSGGKLPWEVALCEDDEELLITEDDLFEEI